MARPAAAAAESGLYRRCLEELHKHTWFTVNDSGQTREGLACALGIAAGEWDEVLKASGCKSFTALERAGFPVWSEVYGTMEVTVEGADGGARVIRKRNRRIVAFRSVGATAPPAKPVTGSSARLRAE